MRYFRKYILLRDFWYDSELTCTEKATVLDDQGTETSQGESNFSNTGRDTNTQVVFWFMPLAEL